MTRYLNDLLDASKAVFNNTIITVSGGRAILADPTSTSNTATFATIAIPGVTKVSGVIVRGNERAGRLRYLIKSDGEYYSFNATTGEWEKVTNTYVAAQAAADIFSADALKKLPDFLGEVFDFTVVAYFMGDATAPSPFITQVQFDYDKLDEGNLTVIDTVRLTGRVIDAKGNGVADTITATLSSPSVYSGVAVDVKGVVAKTDAAGNWSLDLLPNHDADTPVLVPHSGQVYSFYTIKTKTKTYEVVINRAGGAEQTIESLESRLAFVNRVYA